MLKVKRVSKAVADSLSNGVPYGGKCEESWLFKYGNVFDGKCDYAWIVRHGEAFDDWCDWFVGSLGFSLDDDEERRIRWLVGSLKPDEGLVISWDIETDESGAMLLDRIVGSFLKCTDGKYYADARVFGHAFVVVSDERLERFEAFEFADEDAKYNFGWLDKVYDAPELGEHIGQCKIENPEHAEIMQ